MSITDKKLAETLNKVKKNQRAMSILKSARKLGITTLGYAKLFIEEKPTIRVLRETANRLVTPSHQSGMDPLLERRAPKLFGYNGRPENVYILTKLGAAVLNELLLEETIKAPKIRDQWDLAHRYIILKVAELAEKEKLNAQMERVFKNTAQEVRADLYLEINSMEIIFEVEQKLLRRNLKRARKKFKNWANYIWGEDTTYLHVYLVLNGRTRSMPTIIRYWQEALDDVRRELNGLPYDVYYMSTKELLESPSITDALYKAKLFDDLDIEDEQPAVFLGDEDVWDIDDEEPALPDYINPSLYIAFQDALDTLFDVPPEKALDSLSELAMLIYSASYYKNSPSLKVAVFPWASIWFMHRYLGHPRMTDVRKELATALTRFQKRNPGMVMLRETVTSLLWDVLLFHHGLGRGGILRVVFQVPDFQDKSSDFRVEVRVDSDLRASQTEDIKALNWFFSSIYLYRRQLGLVEEKKNRKEK